jgi:hypothetical protein
MTEPPQPPATPDEPWSSGEQAYPPPGGEHPRPMPGSPQGPPQGPPQQSPQQGPPPGSYPQQPYPQGGYEPPAGYPQGYPQGGYEQSGYPQAGYPQAGYPQGGYDQPGYPPAAPRPATLNLGQRLGARLVRRPEPRFTIALAAAGAALALVGVLLWSGGYFADGLDINFNVDSGTPTTHGESRRFLGAGLSFVVALAGYALVIIRRRGPLATAGAVAGAIGIPLTMIFLTLDVGGIFSGQFPINLDAVYLVSILAWLASYLFVPGAQGRSFYLGLAALNLATYVGYKAAGNALLQSAASTVNSGGLTTGGSSTDSLGAVSLVFGLIYYAIAAFLDKRGRTGAAVALVVAGFFVTVTGVVSLAPSFGLAGTGVLLIILGAVLGWYGGFFGRRFTTWVWTAGVPLGVVLIIAKISPNNYTAAGVSMIVIGTIVAVAAYLLSSAVHEPPDIEDAQAPAVMA